MPLNETCGMLCVAIGASRDQPVDTAGYGSSAAGTGHKKYGLVASDDGFRDRALTKPTHTFFKLCDELGLVLDLKS